MSAGDEPLPADAATGAADETEARRTGGTFARRYLGPDESGPLPARAANLATQLIRANYNAYVETSQALIDNLTEQLALAEAELAAIRTTVEELYSHSWNPRSHHVLAALHPAVGVIEAHRRNPANG